MSTHNRNRFISFFGNGPYWDNFIKTMAYPYGYSYARPFRYRDEWLDAQIIDVLRDGNDIESLYGRAVLSTCFTTENYTRKLLPIREVFVEHIESSNDDYEVFFRLGSMIDFRTDQSLEQMCVELTEQEEGKLFFNSDHQIPQEQFISKEYEDDTWPDYCGKIAGDNTLPINDRARMSMFFRMAYLGKRANITPKIIGNSQFQGNSYGAVLKEGQNYEVKINHRVPFLLGRHMALEEFPVEYKVNSNNVELSKSEEQYSANYGQHVLAISALHKSGTSEELIVRPSVDYHIIDDDTTIYTHRITIPIKVKFDFWFQIRNVWIPAGLLVAAFALLALVDILPKIISNGTISQENWISIIFALIAAAASSMLIYLKGKI